MLRGPKDNKFYLRDLCSEMGVNCINGHVDGNTVNIDMPQYLSRHGAWLPSLCFRAVSEIEAVTGAQEHTPTSVII